jgi:hypothetical protein
MATLEQLEAEMVRRQALKSETQPEVQTAEDQQPNRLQQLEAEAQNRGLTPGEPTTLGDIGEGAGALGMEGVSAANRAVTDLLDFFGPGTLNAALEVAGIESRLPTFSGATNAPKGQFSQGTIAEGLPTDIIAGASEFGVNAATGQGLIKQGAKQLAPLAKNTASRVLREFSKPSVKSATAFGATSGAGSEIGREVGGETGALIGSVVAPVAAVTALGGAKVLIPKLAAKFGKNLALIDQQTALPSPAFQKALDKRGLQYGSIIDDVDSLPVLRSNLKPDEVVERILQRKLISGASDDVTATLRLDAGRIVPDQLGEEAIKQGFRPGKIAAIKSMNSSTKTEAVKMLNMTRQILANDSLKDKFRPTNVVGDNVKKQFDFIRGKADILRLDLDRIANKPAAGANTLGGPGVTPGLKGLEINTNKIENAVLGGLDKLKLNIPDDVLKDTKKLSSFLKGNEAFTGSLISENPSSKNIIRRSVKLLSEPGEADASRAHIIKKQLDELIDFNKASRQGLTDSGKNFAKAVRSAVNETIRDVSPRYANINDELSLSLQSMNKFQKVLGPSIDVFDKGASSAIGQDLRGLLSNRKTRVNLENAVDSIADTAAKLGGKFDVDVKNLTRFANTLDDRFGAVADTSLKGEVESVIREGARATAVKKVAEGAEKLRGINEKNALNSIQKILMRKI